MNRRNSTRRLSVQNSGVPMNMDSLLDLFSYQTLSHLPDHMVQSLIVPHQRSSLNNFATDEMRAIKRDLSTLPDMAALRSVYGVVVNQADATRIAEEGETTSVALATPFLGNAESAPGLYSAQSGNASSPSASSPALRRAGSVVTFGGAATFAQMNDSVSTIAEVQGVLSKIRALKIPPLSPDFGSLNQPSDGRPYRSLPTLPPELTFPSMFTEALDTSVFGDAMATQPWKPRENTVVSMMFEHTAAVNRLAVPHDQSFFVSASSDGTARVWSTKGVERNAFPRSVIDSASVSPPAGVLWSTSKGAGGFWTRSWSRTLTRLPPAQTMEVCMSGEWSSGPATATQ
jgi:WD40 repeat protein